MATAAGKITTAKLRPEIDLGVAVLGTLGNDGRIRPTGIRRGSVIFHVDSWRFDGRGASRTIFTGHIEGGRQGVETTPVPGAQTWLLATIKDKARVKREAAKASDKVQAIEDSASVLTGVTVKNAKREAAKAPAPAKPRRHIGEALSAPLPPVENYTLATFKGHGRPARVEMSTGHRGSVRIDRHGVWFTMDGMRAEMRLCGAAGMFLARPLAEESATIALKPCNGDWQQQGCASGLPSVHRVTTHGATRDVCAYHSPYDVNETHPAGTEIPAAGTTDGTVMVRNRRVVARQDLDGAVTRFGNNGQWVKVGATVAATFQPTMPNVGGSAEEIARHKAASAHIGEALSAPLPSAPVTAMAAVKRAYRDPAVAAANFRALADACQRDADKAKAKGHKSWWAKSQAATYWDTLSVIAESGAA